MTGKNRIAIILASVLVFMAGAMSGTSHAATAKLGNTAIGSNTDVADTNYMNASRHTTG